MCSDQSVVLTYCIGGRCDAHSSSAMVTNCLADECRARQIHPRKRTPIGERERLN
jgi:hypothetical protein